MDMTIRTTIMNGIEVAVVLGFNQYGMLSDPTIRLYLDEKKAYITLAKLQVREYQMMRDSIDEEAVLNIDEGRKNARKALNDFSFYSKAELKQVSTNNPPEFYVPRTYRTLTFMLTEEDVERIAKGRGFQNINWPDKAKEESTENER